MAVNSSLKFPPRFSQPTYLRAISLRDPYFTLRKYDLVMVLSCRKHFLVTSKDGCVGKAASLAGTAVVTPPARRAQVRVGDVENRHPGSRCEALARGLSPKVTDGQRDAVC